MRMQDHDAFIQAAKRTPVDLEAWAVEMMQKANRKSHLQAPLSPATQALLRSEGPFSGGHSPGRDPSNSKTPTSGEIPIAASAGTQDSASSTSTFTPESVHRVMSADVAGGHHNSYANERPGYPPRTSSASSKLPTRDSQTYIQPTAMPFRPAPPTGPLPHPPGRDGLPTRRQMYPPHGQEGQMI